MDWEIIIPVLIAVLIATIGPLLIYFHDRDLDKQMTAWADDHFITLATYDADTGIMIITYKSGRVAKFKGSGTVWFTFPMMERCHTPFEAKLVDIKRYIKEHGNPYPIAHEIV